jgi:KDO2-lipid IV(A) lauroyltransferase
MILQIIFKVLSKLPLRLNRQCGKLLGLIFYLGGRTKHITQQNIVLCFPHLSSQKQQQLLKKTLAEIGKYTLENFFIWGRSFADNAKYITSTQGLECINTTRPTILLVPHFGGFEITGRVLSLSRNVKFLYKPAKQKQLEKLIFQHRNQNNLIMLPTTNKGIVSLAKALKNNELVGILPDQHPSGESGFEMVDFFNIPTKTTTLLAKLALKYKTDVILTYALRNNKGYDLVLKKVDIKADNLKESVQKMHKIIEELVKKYPQQYLWNYKKFKATYDYNKQCLKT